MKQGAYGRRVANLPVGAKSSVRPGWPTLYGARTNSIVNPFPTSNFWAVELLHGTFFPNWGRWIYVGGDRLRTLASSYLDFLPGGTPLWVWW